MKICFITSGVITQHPTMKRAFGMAKPLVALGHDVTICLQDAPDNQAVIAQCPGVSAHYFQQSSLAVEREQKHNFLNKHHFDVVHICGLGFRNAILPPAKTFTIMDHVELESSLVGVSFLRKFAQFLLEEISLLIYPGSVTASKYLENLFSQHLNRLWQVRPILYLPYAFDPSHLRIENSEIQAFRHKYPNRKIIVYMGGIYRNYGCFEMLEAFRKLAAQRQDFIALILGRGPDFAAAIEFVKQNQLQAVVEFQGYVPEEEVPIFLGGADVLLSPLNDTVADWARCPSKLLMYIATRHPIVTCAISEALEYLGEDGFYYEPNSVDSMISAIEKAFEVGNSWKPNYNPQEHTWQARVQSWLNWITENKKVFDN
jgi:glycosyltransferase involved in cell wall biosynthesis